MTVAQVSPKITVYRALSEEKETRDLREIKKIKGALFADLIKKCAQKQSITL